MLGCCPSGPPALLMARANAVFSVRAFNIHSKPGQPFFCANSYFRQCEVVGLDNGVCGFTPPEHVDASASIPLFAEQVIGAFDPCNTNESLTYELPIGFGAAGMSAKLNVCWDGTYTLSVPTTVDDMIAATMAYLSLINLNDVPLGTERRVSNNFFNGSPVFADFPIAAIPGPDACVQAGSRVASCFTVRYMGVGEVFHCTSARTRRIQMPTYLFRITIARSRFEVNADWCKRTRTNFLLDPDFVSTNMSGAGACVESECVHHQAASGIIEVPQRNSSIHIGLCSNPPAPCNPTPIPF